jgi:carboxypeptidase C (cathepsin A)
MKTCTKCPKGKYSAKKGAGNCHLCPQGTIGTFIGGYKKSCDGSCDARGGYQSNANRTKCVWNATLEDVTAAQVARTEERKEDHKKMAEKAVETKIAAAKRKKAASTALHSMVDGVSHMEVCDAGYYRNALSSIDEHYCTACPRGKYQPKSGGDSCVVCRANFTTLSRGTVPAAGCNVPKFQVGATYANPKFSDPSKEQTYKWPKDVLEKYKKSTKVHLPGMCDAAAHEAGYITVDKEHAKNLFYQFSPARKNPRNKPLILWLAGGPGLSSLTNMFFDNGPCHVTDKLKLEKNIFSWTEDASVIWLDQPAGVGFSYVLSKRGAATTMKQVAADALKFMLQWFDDHIDYSHNDFYIFGDSYAGHFVTAIAHEIHYANQNPADDDFTSIKLKGIGIQNGLVNPIAQFPEYIGYAKHNPFTKHLLTTGKVDKMMEKLPKCLLALKLCNFHDSKIANSKEEIEKHCLRARSIDS